jgi:prepilin-type N-terminal cleavage/methylation domain-containing protein
MKKGFTLLEILIAITVFSIIVTSFLSLFGSAFTYQRESLSKAYLLNNGSYITGYISRNLRMAKKELGTPATCLSTRGLNYELTSGGQGIKFIDYQESCNEIYLENNVIKVDRDGTVENLTPSNITVENLEFSVSGASQDDLIQPKVTFTIELNGQSEPVQTLNFQTTISQRQLDAEY